MTSRSCVLKKPRRERPLTRGYLHALRGFRDYCLAEKIPPTQGEFALVLRKSKSTARQALEYLTGRGLLENTGKATRPWLLTDAGAKVLRRADRSGGIAEESQVA